MEVKLLMQPKLQQKIAIEIAAENFNRFSKSNKLSLHFQDSSGLDPRQDASAGQ